MEFIRIYKSALRLGLKEYSKTKSIFKINYRECCRIAVLKRLSSLSVEKLLLVETINYIKDYGIQK